MTIIRGNCLDVLKEYPDNHFTSIVTDPPYGLAFMGRKWDYDVPSIEIWKECLRVLKPGGTMLCFAGSRTQHSMAVNIEDSGFVIKDCLMWLYASGFPKSLSVGKAVDKLQGTEREKVCISKNGAGNKAIKNLSGSLKEKDRITISPIRQKEGKESFKEFEITKGTSDFEGYGTALKPAYEPIIIAIKPNDGSYAENALKWGVSGINIDAGRIGTNVIKTNEKKKNESFTSLGNGEGFNGCKESFHQGRFPANIILECVCDEVVDGENKEVKKGTDNRKDDKSFLGTGFGGVHNEDNSYNDTGNIHTNPNCPCFLLDDQSRISKSRKQEVSNKGSIWHSGNNDKEIRGHNDKGGASRFFYTAKASKAERNAGCEGLPLKNMDVDGVDRNQAGFNYADRKAMLPRNNFHPTVKPLKLMKYLINLIMPPKDGILLDPFAGSGSTIVASTSLGYISIGIELDKDYCDIARKRVELEKEKTKQQELF